MTTDIVTTIQVPEVIETTLSVGQGPSGPRGNVGMSSASQFSFTAGAAIGGHRVVKLDSEGKVQYASASSVDDRLSIVGVTVGAASNGADCTVQNADLMEDVSWSWIPGEPIFLGELGVMTQAIPTNSVAEFLQVVGQALSPTKIVVSLREPIVF